MSDGGRIRVADLVLTYDDYEGEWCNGLYEISPRFIYVGETYKRWNSPMSTHVKAGTKMLAFVSRRLDVG